MSGDIILFKGTRFRIILKSATTIRTHIEWLSAKKSEYSAEADRIAQKEVKTNELPDGDDDVEFYYPYYQMPSSKRPYKTTTNDWVYVIDLDRNAFSVDILAHFALD